MENGQADAIFSKDESGNCTQLTPHDDDGLWTPGWGVTRPEWRKRPATNPLLKELSEATRQSFESVNEQMLVMNSDVYRGLQTALDTPIGNALNDADTGDIVNVAMGHSFTAHQRRDGTLVHRAAAGRVARRRRPPADGGADV
jgi:hypothetical protein